jgi:hypothetical protein
MVLVSDSLEWRSDRPHVARKTRFMVLDNSLAQTDRTVYDVWRKHAQSFCFTGVTATTNCRPQILTFSPGSRTSCRRQVLQISWPSRLCSFPILSILSVSPMQCICSGKDRASPSRTIMIQLPTCRLSIAVPQLCPGSYISGNGPHSRQIPIKHIPALPACLLPEPAEESYSILPIRGF